MEFSNNGYRRTTASARLTEAVALCCVYFRKGENHIGLDLPFASMKIADAYV